MTSWADDRWEIEAGVLRPYLLTSGRTRNETGVGDLAVEAMVETTPLGKESVQRLRTEHRNIIELCFTPQSLAEVSARLRAPFGVVRVLVGDLVDHHLVRIHNALGEVAGRDLVADVELLQRLMSRIKAIPA